MPFSQRGLRPHLVYDDLTVWYYRTADAPQAMLEPGYFDRCANDMRRGDMILARASMTEDGGWITGHLAVVSVAGGRVTVAPESELFSVAGEPKAEPEDPVDKVAEIAAFLREHPEAWDGKTPSKVVRTVQAAIEDATRDAIEQALGEIRAEAEAGPED